MQLKISAMKKDIFKCVIKKFLSFLLVCMNVYCFPLLFVHFDRYKTNMRIFYLSSDEQPEKDTSDGG